MNKTCAGLMLGNCDGDGSRDIKRSLMYASGMIGMLGASTIAMEKGKRRKKYKTS